MLLLICGGPTALQVVSGGMKPNEAYDAVPQLKQRGEGCIQNIRKRARQELARHRDRERQVAPDREARGCAEEAVPGRRSIGTWVAQENRLAPPIASCCFTANQTTLREVGLFG